MFKKLFSTLMGLTLGLIFFGAALLAIAVLVTYPKLPSLESVTNYKPKMPLMIYSSDEKLIGMYGEERRNFTKIDDFPKDLRNAVIAAEDQRFYSHWGVDVMGVARAMVGNLTGGVRSGASTITREMNKRHLTVRVNLRGVDLTAFLNNANALIDKEVKYDHDSVHLKWAGQFENQHRAYARLGAVVPLALGLMLLLLFAACGKFRQAALMMSVVPLALFGGMLALNVRGMTLNVSSAVGFIALVGVAIQNGVIMISHINNLRTRERDLKDAVITGTKHRFRPILMTATVAVLGLLPASVSTGIGSDVQRPLATVIVYGLLFATVITLYVLPALYYMIEKHYEGKDLTPVSEEKELHA